MSTAEETGKPSSASSSATVARKRSYIPGGPVSRGKRTSRHRPLSYHDLPADILDKIIGFMVGSHTALSVIKLSMVNRHLRSTINANLDMWYRLYLQWRGPVGNSMREYSTPRGIIRLRPTVPISVPNFRIKTPPLT